MLVNLYQGNHQMEVIPGTRMLHAGLGIIGHELCDPMMPDRHWTINGLYAPVHERVLGGVRAKVQDQKGFVSFCNQRDLEVLLELAKPGDWCIWAGAVYVAPKSTRWCGFCMDQTDLLDDLYERELGLRAEYPDTLPDGLDIARRVHTDTGEDFEELWVLLRDADPENGYGPDYRRETLEYRWARASRSRLQWKRI